MELILRIGTFFILVGVGLLLLFIGSVMGNDINVVYLFLSLVSLFAGFMLRRNKPPVENQRFGALRRMNERNRQRRQEKDKKDKK
jgi:hypothetical protein